MSSIYHLLLIGHSYNRWLVLVALISLLGTALYQRKRDISFHQRIPFLQKLVLVSIDIQLTLGLLLYYYSPIPSYFWNNLPETIKEREIRFFGLEHIFVMLIAAFVIHWGLFKSKNKPSNSEKYKSLIIWATLGLLLILSSIPWSFSPLISRPLFR